MTNEAELRKEISSIVHKILIVIRKDRIIPNGEISRLIDYLDEIKIFTKGEMIYLKNWYMNYFIYIQLLLAKYLTIKMMISALLQNYI